MYNDSTSELNPYKGGVFPQAVSALTDTEPTAYELNGGAQCITFYYGEPDQKDTSGAYSVYGFEYKPGFDNAARILIFRIVK